MPVSLPLPCSSWVLRRLIIRQPASALAQCSVRQLPNVQSPPRIHRRTKSSKPKFSKAFYKANPKPESIDPEALALAAKENIGLHYELKPFKAQQPEFLLGIRVCTRHTFFYIHMKYFDKLGHALAPMFLSLYSDKSKEPLWFTARAFTDGCKAVVRRHAEKRARWAFREALSKNGYDRFGRRLAESSTEAGSGRERPDLLYGTVVFRIQDSRDFLKLDSQSVVEYLSSILMKLETTLGKKDSTPDW